MVTAKSNHESTSLSHLSTGTIIPLHRHVEDKVQMTNTELQVLHVSHGAGLRYALDQCRSVLVAGSGAIR